MPRLPDFLVVGAMKSGTTSLYFDLAASPSLFVGEKETRNLLSDAVLEPAGREEYGRRFRDAGADQVCGEVSSFYAKLPDLQGASERALSVCGDRLKVIYLVREPVARIVSHHHHDHAFGAVGPDIDRAVREYSPLLDYSRYAMQLAPWIEKFGRERVLVIRFERYVGDRQATIDEVAAFLGVPSHSELIRSEKVYNRSQGKPMPSGLAWRLSRGDLYQRWLRPVLPSRLRWWLVNGLLPKAPGHARPAPATVDWILDSLAEDQAELQRILGSEEPLWEESEVRARFADHRVPGERDGVRRDRVS